MVDDSFFGGFDAVDGGGGDNDANRANDNVVFEGFAAVDGGAVDDDAVEGGGAESTVPAWYAGKLSRAICEETVLAASKGDFLVRESSRGDRCVVSCWICVDLIAEHACTARAVRACVCVCVCGCTCV